VQDPHRDHDRVPLRGGRSGSRREREDNERLEHVDPAD
jgi:hypothetical protein